MDVENIRRKIEELERHYDGDNDTRPDTPRVWWADAELLDICKKLLALVEDHNGQLEYLQGKVSYLDKKKDEQQELLPFLENAINGLTERVEQIDPGGYVRNRV